MPKKKTDVRKKPRKSDATLMHEVVTGLKETHNAEQAEKATKDRERFDLTEKDVKILTEYVSNGFNQARALMAGSSKMSYESARPESSKYFSKPHIKAAISKYLDKLISQARDTLIYEVLDYYRTRAFYDIRDVLNSEGELSEENSEIVKKVVDGKKQRYVGLTAEETDAAGKVIKQPEPIYAIEYILADRDKALEMLTKYMDMLPKIKGVGFESTEGKTSSVIFKFED